MKTQISKEEEEKVLKEALKKQQVLSILIKENAFSRNDKQLWNMLGHSSPTIVQKIKEKIISKPETIDNHWNNFTKRFQITEEGMCRLLDTLEKYNDLKKTFRKGVGSLELLEVIENPATEKITRTMTFLNKCNIHEKTAFVGLAVYDEMMKEKKFTIIAYYDKLRKLFYELWPHRNFAINKHFMGIELIDITEEFSKLDSIVQTTFNYLLMKQEYEKIRNIPYTNCFNNLFQRTDIETDSFWLEENTARIWYVSAHIVQNEIDGYLMAVFDEYNTKCSEVYLFEFWNEYTVSVSCLPQKHLGYYDYKLSDNGDSMEFTSDEGFSRHKLPAKLLRVGTENPAVKFLKSGMDEESINDAAELYVCDVVTDVTISRKRLTVTTIDGAYSIKRDKCPDIRNLHPDDECYLMILREKVFVIFRGDYILNIPLEDFELLTNEE